MTVGVTTLGTISDKVLQRIDRVGSGFFPTSELYPWISDSYKELYDLLVQKFGDDYFFAAPYNITTDGTNDTYALPVDFYKLYGVDLSINGGAPNGWLSVRQFMKSERNRYVFPNMQNFYGLTNVRYRLRGSNIWFTPLPAASQLFRLLYCPRPAELTVAADTVDGVSGWEEYIILDVGIKCLAKEESDPSTLMAQKQGVLKRIEEAAENRNVGQPQTLSDNSGDFGPLGGWGNSGGF